MDADRSVPKHPFPLLSAVRTGAGFSAADQPTAAQPGEDFRHAMIQAAFDQLEQVG
jgi:hypothetical protein